MSDDGGRRQDLCCCRHHGRSLTQTQWKRAIQKAFARLQPISFTATSLLIAGVVRLPIKVGGLV